MRSLVLKKGSVTTVSRRTHFYCCSQSHEESDEDGDNLSRRSFTQRNDLNNLVLMIKRIESSPVNRVCSVDLRLSV